MKISVNEVELLVLTEIQKKVIKNDIHADEFDNDMKRRINYILMHKYERCFARLKQEWDPKFSENGVSMIPTNKDAYAQLVFDQPNYKDRKDREIAARGRL